MTSKPIDEILKEMGALEISLSTKKFPTFPKKSLPHDDKYVWESQDIWRPNKVKEQEQIEAEQRAREKMMEDIMKHWEYEYKQTHQADPTERLRREMRQELDEIKDAIRKIGILLDSDAPSEETLKKHKALREAYLKYKMIEKLVLGGGEKGKEGDDGGSP